MARRSSAPGTVVLRPENAQQLRQVLAEDLKRLQSGSGHTRKDEAPLVGFLVSFDAEHAGEYYPLRKGRTIITTDQDAGLSSAIMLNGNGISSSHAVIRADSEADILILDQLSDSGTFLRRLESEDEIRIREPAAVLHGDVLRFGDRTFQLCLLPRKRDKKEE